MNIGLRLVKIASVYMVIGLLAGVVMGVTGNFTHASVHSHISLLGWLTMAATGFVYLLIPGCAEGRLAGMHFWGHNLGLPVMIVSLVAHDLGYVGAEKFIAAGSMVVLISLSAFAMNLIINGDSRSLAKN